MLCCVFELKNVFPTINFSALISQILVGIIAFGTSLFLTNKDIIVETKDALRR
jgi:hypothetical protein